MNRYDKGPPNSDPLVIGCASDGAYTIPLTVMLKSALTNLQENQPVEIYIIDGGVNPADKINLRDSLGDRASVHWLQPDRSKFVGLPIWGHCSIVTYDRLMVDQLLPADINQLIWLDADMLVLGNLSDLWEHGFENSHILAVKDHLVSRLGSKFGVAGCDELKIDEDSPYFNAGVMVIDLQRWRQDDVSNQAMEYLKRFRDRVFFMEQEALNAVLAGKWLPIDDSWNWNTAAEQKRMTRSKQMGKFGDGIQNSFPHIFHFTGKIKPWLYLGTQTHQELWYEYVDKTAWAGCRPDSNWRKVVIQKYASSSFRQIFLKVEYRLMQLTRKWSFRYITKEDVKPV